MPSGLPPFRLYGGKGGVGKTTCAAAAALFAAENGTGTILAVSTDPAHSLGDAFAARLSPEPVRLKSRGLLLAAELDVERALGLWMAERRAALKTIAERGTYLDDQDLDRLLALSLPGADELVGMLELERLGREGGASERPDEIVVDTAPTAHTLRLLRMPELLRRLAGVLDALQERHRELIAHFGSDWGPDQTDALIAEIGDRGREMGELLRDPERSSFFWVMLPEALSIAETRDALAALDEAGVPVKEIIVNRVTPPRPDLCPLCREKRQAELEAIAEIRDAFGNRGLRFLPLRDREPRGLPALRRIARDLASPSRGEELLADPPPPARRSGARPGLPAPSWVEELAPPELRLLLFGGKGGVGKTTCAAAAAIAIAERFPERQVLLLSTDPAHSLADVLDTPLGDDERPVLRADFRSRSGLRARELDAAAAFEAWRGRRRDEVGGALGAFASGEGKAVVDRLLEITPPGLDELVALSALLDAPQSDGLVIVDTAPAGHALRLLESPEMALEWDHALLAILLKYRGAVGLGDTAAELVGLSRSLKRLIALLRDPQRARFVAVTRAAELPRRQTVRALRELRRLSIAVPAIVVNAVAACSCGGQGDADGELSRLRDRFAGVIYTAPAVYPPPRGTDTLARWARSWQKA